MYRKQWNDHWSFYLDKGDCRDVLEYNIIDLPHDWSIALGMDRHAASGASGGYYPGGIGVYQKNLNWDGPEDEVTLLEVEGAYLDTQVFCNGCLAGVNHHGYSSFHVDLSPFLRFGSNEIRIIVRNASQPNSRWYSGSGLYRGVNILTGAAVGILPWGLYTSTSSLQGKAAEQKVAVELYNRQAPVMGYLHLFAVGPDGQIVAESNTQPALIGQGESVVTSVLRLAQASPWTPETPTLYTLSAQLMTDGQQLDEDTTRFGVRTIDFSAEHGFRLNGTTINLKGGCIHHDNGILGACAYPDAERRKVFLHKQAGFNALRTAHNPPSQALLDACDELGMMVMDELYDCWEVGKMAHGMHDFFRYCWQMDVDNFVRRDRNHPCIILWSIGNEIPERADAVNGARISRELAERVRALDASRGVTNAICSIFADGGPYDSEFNKAFYNYYDYRIPPNTPDAVADMIHESKRLDDAWRDTTQAFCEPLDVVGYNYMEYKYEDDAKRHPGRVIVGSETHPTRIARLWHLVENNTHVIGDFTWTSMDYLGETGLGRAQYHGVEPLLAEYPMHISGCGDIDINGVTKPAGYYRQVVWKVRNHPYIAVLSPEKTQLQEHHTPWGWPDVEHRWSYPGAEGKRTRVQVYASADEVELLVNGEPVGRTGPDADDPFRYTFYTDYQPGRLCAVAYRGAQACGQDEVSTFGAPACLTLEPEQCSLPLRAGGLAFLHCVVVDADGAEVLDANPQVLAHLDGPGRLLAMGSSDPAAPARYQLPAQQAYRGRLMLVVQAAEPGVIRVSVRSSNLKAVTCELSVIG